MLILCVFTIHFVCTVMKTSPCKIYNQSVIILFVTFNRLVFDAIGWATEKGIWPVKNLLQKSH